MRTDEGMAGAAIERPGESSEAEAGRVPPGPDSRFEKAALAMALAGMAIVLVFGLLPLALGVMAARSASLALAGSRVLRSRGAFARLAASAMVGVLAAAAIAGGSAWVFDGASSAIKEAPALVKKFSEQAREARSKLPPSLAERLPDTDLELRAAAEDMLGKALPNIAGAGKSWAGGIILAAIGWIIGLLMANMRDSDASTGPLAVALRERGRRMAAVFERVVAGQFVVACANTVFAGIFMFAILPVFGERMPWAGALMGLTFALSMIPAAGNVLCNAVVALVALSVGPGVAVAALGYLVVVHKVEYFINAKAVGRHVSTSVWELLLAMVALECIFGVAGLVAAPLFYAYVKNELKSLGWV